MKTLLLFLAAFCAQLALAEPTHRMLLLLGAPGEEAYAEGFAKAAATWRSLAEQAGAELVSIGPGATETPHKQLVQGWIQNLDTASPVPVWIVYLGHGTHGPDGAKLNLVGDDIAASELQAWLNPLQSPLIFIHGGSASAPFLPAIAAPNRIVITATRSASQQNYARFGETFAATMADPTADIDQDGQVSLLEAFIMASQKVERFYRESGRLTTEHALLDDDGDAKGSTADLFQGLRPVQDNVTDGLLARRTALIPSQDLAESLTLEQLRRRQTLEAELESLRRRKAELPPDTYYQQLETLLTQLAREVYPPL